MNFTDHIRNYGFSDLCKGSALAAAILAAAAMPCHAEESPDSVTSLKELVVTADADPSPGQTIDLRQIESIPSASVADALKYLAGVQIKDYGGLGGLKTINVRSLGAQHVGVYIDGIRLTNAQNGTVDLGKYSLSTLESVSLYNANRLDECQSASEYASAATVYLQTRRPERDSLTLLAGIGSFHTYRGRVSAEMARKGWSGFIDAEYMNSKGDYPFRYRSEYEDTTGRRRNSDIEFFRAEGALFKGGFSSHIYCYVSERGCPGGIVRRLSDKYTNIGREWDTDLFAQASWRQPLGSRHQLKFNARYSYEYLRYNTDFPENQNTAKVDNHYYQHDAYLSASYAWRPLEWMSVNAGIDGRLSWLDADLKHFSGVCRLDTKGVAAVQLHYRGARLAASLLYQYYKDFTQLSTGAADPLSRLTPSVTLGYTLFGVQLRAWYKCIFRAPTLNDLYYTQAGNRNLKPEYTRQWNLGAEYQWTDGRCALSAQADAYINRIDNRIVCLPLRGTYTWSMMNYGETYCRGLNATLSAAYSPRSWRFSLLTSFTLQRDLNRTDPSDPDTYNMPICYSPTFSCGVTAIAAWRFISLTVSHLHVGKRIWSYADRADCLSPYDNVDLKLTAALRCVEASLEVNDLFDVQYEHIPRYPMPGRTFRLTLTYTL